ncbi:hypothetical protein SPBR_03277 [Sporothrix brasiliensis 5110]|uniref:Lea domain containing protein n=1 Tax=Sporothrix brasiliensis 5110 TaxID=1398154 RepID=A0A0C2F290_9PEZI|nr:uncharacterized protein SPBR_03277 [Sporothrix brasiliensis 5110]KIH93034.1 hypothetical protein SPBR_03277 [Sporothrix brasiliensis 5110]
MSFLTESTLRRVATAAPRISATTFAPRVATASFIHSRHLSSTAPQRKTVTESAKDTLKSVDRAVSDKLVDGINIGCKLAAVADKAKEASKDITGGRVAGKADELRDDLASKAKHAKNDVAYKAEELRDDLASKAKHAKNDAAYKADELRDDLAAKAKHAKNEAAYKADEFTKER